jgi:1-acyl-sn-glycerol-3-phosphate acyltransferase
MVRGTLALLVVAVFFPLLDLWQRVVVAGLVKLFPNRRERLLGAWIRAMARATWYGVAGGIGGAHLPDLPRIPAGPGILVLMNHQSLLDIPLVVLAVEEGYPLIVTRRRYARRIPLVSFMLRLYDFPLVDPGRMRTAQLEVLAEAAASAERPTVIYPEGGRTRDGEIRPFKRGGLRAILCKRSWKVYLLVNDGFWNCARITEFIHGVSGIQGKSTCAGPFQFTGDEENVDDFIARMQEQMRQQLDEIRGDGAASG